MTAPSQGVLVQCIGNPDRRDDGAGIAVADRLAGCLPDRAKLLRRSGDMLALIDDWDDCAALVCVDAIASLGSPGTIHRLDLSCESIPSDMMPMSSHAFGLGEAIALARSLGSAPGRIVIFGVEGTDFSDGVGLSPKVSQSIDPLATRVIGEVATLLEETAHA